MCALVASIGVGCSSEATSSSDPSPAAPARECVGATSDALRVCATSRTSLAGIDVSSYQGSINWAKVASSGRAFAFMRVSDGSDKVDTRFAQSWPAARKAGVARGAYQYFRPSQDAAAQAKLLVAKIQAAGGLEAGDLPPVLDVENAESLASSVVVARAKRWLAAVESELGVKPIVYTAAFMSDVLGNGFSNYVLWVANYGVSCPQVPSGWTRWRFWQSSDKGSVPGIAGAVDLDTFDGTLADLQAMTFGGGLRGPSAGALGEPSAMPATTAEAEAAQPGVLAGDREGATLGSAQPPEAPPPPLDPCSR